MSQAFVLEPGDLAHYAQVSRLVRRRTTRERRDGDPTAAGKARVIGVLVSHSVSTAVPECPGHGCVELAKTPLEPRLGVGHAFAGCKAGTGPREMHAASANDLVLIAGSGEGSGGGSGAPLSYAPSRESAVRRWRPRPRRPMIFFLMINAMQPKVDSGAVRPAPLPHE